jgi:hypothetical protein
MSKSFSDIIKGRFEAAGQIVKTMSGENPDDIVVNPMESVIPTPVDSAKGKSKFGVEIVFTDPDTSRQRKRKKQVWRRDR